MPFITDRNIIFTEGSVIFIFDFDTMFFIQNNEGCEVFLFTVLVDRHCIIWEESKNSFVTMKSGRKLSRNSVYGQVGRRKLGHDWKVHHHS